MTAVWPSHQLVACPAILSDLHRDSRRETVFARQRHSLGVVTCRPMTLAPRTLPTFLIIGCGKCGTSSLFWYLGGHPQVSPSTHKEVNFFNRDENWNHGLDWYAQFFRNGAGSIARG